MKTCVRSMYRIEHWGDNDSEGKAILQNILLFIYNRQSGRGTKGGKERRKA